METNIQNLGQCNFVSPLTHSSFEVTFRSDSDRVLFNHLRTENGQSAHEGEESGEVGFELAGPREKLFFDPGKTTAAIVTCGGLCPGLNDIVRGIVTQCHTRYGVTRTFGFRYGYQGMISRLGLTPLTLRPESVAQIHNFGGSILGTSRGHQDIGGATYVEATGAINGIGLLKLMGRDSGFIACYAALAGSNVDFVMIPEVHFELEGSGGLLEALHYRVAKRRSAVLVVAEGAGQHLMPPSKATDASGNKVYGDIGAFLRDKITQSFRERKVECSVKYIDPSYMIRSVPANAQDNVYCSQLAQHAVHAALAGKTGMLIGRWHGAFVHLPLDMVTNGRRKVDPQGELWNSVLESTGQPARLY
ncbi:MAG: ATP-dependent 6-phosphofructokinase [Verrucomicrobia bacterium]|nr:ATP-dependent 6-phosphofructokinase [Verrucomicrobiota bacterium]